MDSRLLKHLNINNNNNNGRVSIHVEITIWDTKVKYEEIWTIIYYSGKAQYIESGRETYTRDGDPERLLFLSNRAINGHLMKIMLAPGTPLTAEIRTNTVPNYFDDWELMGFVRQL
eukprot:TRINITY_DN2892_c0_g2_i1.p1 TRINITY_DN2892_c0_g2~~TRINITY_DN2892_c0_g2_i1.p1  ORF type:complete len:116 (+),score=11.67 TRINITY_DN2892_c0_g2_i1:313-660(+)